MSRIALAGGCCLAVGAALGLSAVAGVAKSQAKPHRCGSLAKHNLIKNAAAEAAIGSPGDTIVAVLGWKGTAGFTAASYAWTGGDVSSTTVGPPRRCKNYFYGGPASLVSTGTQTIALGKAAPGKTAVLAGWLRGFSTQTDYATLTVAFAGAGGATLAPVLQIGPVTAAQRANVSKLVCQTAQGVVPKGAVSAKVVLTMRRFIGSDNDGLADNLSLRLLAKPPASTGHCP